MASGIKTISPSSTNPVLKVGYTTSHTGWSGDTALYTVTLTLKEIESLPGTNSPYFGYYIQLNMDDNRQPTMFKENEPRTWSGDYKSDSWGNIPKGTHMLFETNCYGWSDWFSLSYDNPTTYTVSYDANGGSGAPGNQTKYNLKDLTLSSSTPTWANHSFLGWNTKSNGTGTSYAKGATYKDNANLVLYAQWKELGAYINVKANNYFTDSQAATAQYISAYNNNTFTLINNGTDGNAAYPSSPKLATMNATSVDYDLFPAPYYDSNQVNFLGYWTGRTFNQTSNVQIYSPTNWLYNSTRAHVAKAVGDGQYFKSDATGTGTSNDIQVWQNQEVTVSNNYVIPTPGTGGVGTITMPQWNKTDGSTSTFWAMWENKNLIFTFDPDNGTTNEAHVDVIGPTGFEEGKAKSYTFPTAEDIKGFNYTPKIGYYANGNWYTHPEATRPQTESAAIVSSNNTIDFGKYILNTTFYASWSPFIHNIKISFDGTETSLGDLGTFQGGETYTDTQLTSIIDQYKIDNSMEDATFYGLYTKRIGGKRIFEADGTPSNDGIYFINNVWAYRTESTEQGTPVLLYAHWIPDTNGKMNVSSDPNNPIWKYGYIYINRNANNPNQEPDWEQVPMVKFM